MKTRQEVTPEKLRGGFYTPASLVVACLAKVRERVGADSNLRVLEPSSGDGAFIRVLGGHEFRGRVHELTAIEPLDIEAEKCRVVLRGAQFAGSVLRQSAIEWGSATDELYDVAVGNPPFVRYQFVADSDRVATLKLGERLGIEIAGVSNLWIPVLLAALARLRAGGVFAFVVPTECLTGVSARVVRRWLIEECEEISFDLFAPGSFPDVLQEIAILSGRRALPRRSAVPLPVRVNDHSTGTAWSYDVRDAGTWTRYLLGPTHLEALDAARLLPIARPLGELVAFEVSIVTGANDYFAIDDATLHKYGLEEWAVPLLPRARFAPGLIFTPSDRDAARAAGAKAWLLDFGKAKPDPTAFDLPRRYIQLGEEHALPSRYKCRIRDPWYRVPGIVHRELLLSKRSHHWPRVILNDARSYTTDTIYRGRMVAGSVTAADVTASFHNSLTLLTAELEGRSFGGGVLELVPSEIGRLITLVPIRASRTLSELDAIARSAEPESLIEETDRLLAKTSPELTDLLPGLRAGRELLAARRHARNRGIEAESILDLEAA